MATRQHQQIVETPTEARQAEPGPSVLALLTASTGLAILILGVIVDQLFGVADRGIRRRWGLTGSNESFAPGRWCRRDHLLRAQRLPDGNDGGGR